MRFRVSCSRREVERLRGQTLIGNPEPSRLRGLEFLSTSSCNVRDFDYHTTAMIVLFYSIPRDAWDVVRRKH